MSGKKYIIHATRKGVIFEYTQEVYDRCKASFFADGYEDASEKEKKDAGIIETKAPLKSVNKASGNKKTTNKKEETPVADPPD